MWDCFIEDMKGFSTIKTHKSLKMLLLWFSYFYLFIIIIIFIFIMIMIFSGSTSGLMLIGLRTDDKFFVVSRTV